MRIPCLAVLLLLAAPAAAHASVPGLAGRDLPLHGKQRAAADARFTMVGLHWQGSGSVDFRSRGAGGRWSAWRPAAPEDEDRPDRGTSERTAPGWRTGNPYWTGPSTRLEVRAKGAVRRVRAYFVRSAPRAVPVRTLSLAGSPQIVSRLAWGADESIRRGAPRYADGVSFTVVHHTAGTNSYTRAQSAAIVRGIQTYHVRGNGWDDIGYNFLVDKYGQIFEGRFGGIDRNVIGAHAEGFNAGSVGIAVLGTYGGGGISAAARDALVRLAAWRLDVAHVDPVSTLSWPSGGNARFARGVPVFLRAVSGHRDTGFTDCPGAGLYSQLNDVAARIGRTGLPKLYEPAVRGSVGGPVRFTGRLTAALPWTVAVADAAGARVASGSGTGTAIDWTWDARGAPPGTYSWTIDAGPTVLPARGTVGRAAVLSLTGAAVDPPVLAPGDAGELATTISFTLGTAATVTARLLDAHDVPVSVLLSGPRPAGRQNVRLTVDGLAEGGYSLELVAQAAGREVRARVPLSINRTLGVVTASSPVLSPNGDGTGDTVRFAFALARPADVRVRIVRGGKWVATLLTTPLGEGEHSVEWNGRKPHGRLRDGDYEVEVRAANWVGSVSRRAPVAVDTTPPTLRLVSLRPLRVRVSEPARLVLRVNGRWSARDRRKPGLVTIGRPSVLRTLRVVARDAAGNASRPLVYRR